MLRITRYRTWEELQELRPLWNSLLSRSASDTVFLTWQWCEAWWKNYGSGREIFVLAAWDAKKLVAIAPLYREEARLYGQHLRRLRLIGDGSHDSDYLDCFAEHSREGETMAAFADFLRTERKSWDWMELNGPRKGSACATVLLACAREQDWKFDTELIPCSTLSLPNNWDAYLRMLEPRFRTKMRSSLALIDNIFKSTPTLCSSENEIEIWLPSLFDLHARRWASENLPGVFCDRAKRTFYHDLSRAALEAGWLAFHRLNWGERPLALQYGLVYRNCFHLLQEGYDPDFATIRPGVALRAWLMRYWIESGLGEYDFLAGTAKHKLDWGAKEVSATRLLISSTPAVATFVLNLPKLRDQVRERIARRTPNTVLSLRKKILAGRQKNILPTTNSGHQSKESASIGRSVRRLASVVYSSGLFGAAGRTIATKYAWNGSRQGWLGPIHRRERPVLHIFQYHRVNDDGDPFLSGLDVDTFRAQMEYLVHTFPIVTLDQVASEGFPNQHQYAAAVTFDDGYRDNFVCAFPILKQLRIPATIFLATGYIDSEQLPWYDQVRFAFKLTTRSRFSVGDMGGPGGCLTIYSSRLRLMEQTLGWLREMPEAERDSALTEIYRALGVPADLNLPNQMLRWEEIRQMSKQGISFGAHTVTHPVLSKISGPTLKREIGGSKKTIENRLQMPVPHFAYPFGQARDFSPQAKDAIREAGFKTAVTTIWGLNEPGDDPLELKRFTPWETNLAEFKMKLDWFRFREPQKAGVRNSGQATVPPMAQEAHI
jgi:CelD/BcsL family acetyltransferase involved in cellulose biosynthesis/peptidoglycan/xylan/chitin deacetylase (PgdA/CDA1 family)